MEEKRRKVIGVIHVENLMNSLKEYFEQHPPDYGDTESLLDWLFWTYTECNPIDNDVIKRQFAALRKLLALSPQEYDPVFYQVSDLCLEHGRLAFIEGLRLGVSLMEKLVSGQL